MRRVVAVVLAGEVDAIDREHRRLQSGIVLKRVEVDLVGSAGRDHSDEEAEIGVAGEAVRADESSPSVRQDRPSRESTNRGPTSAGWLYRET